MLLVLFDIDGTLTDTFGIDTECFVQALREEFTIANINSDWSTYPETTDSAIFRDIIQTHFGRTPTDHDTARMKSRFHRRLSDAFQRDHTKCQAFRGGIEFVEFVVRTYQCAAGFATGGWECTARLKLQVAGYDHQCIPMATADDSTRRKEICTIAVDRARDHYGVTGFNPIVCVGDGVWDARAARELGYRFIGRGLDESVFSGLEPDLVIPDFTDVRLLDRAIRPK